MNIMNIIIIILVILIIILLVKIINIKQETFSVSDSLQLLSPTTDESRAEELASSTVTIPNPTKIPYWSGGHDDKYTFNDINLSSSSSNKRNFVLATVARYDPAANNKSYKRFGIQESERERIFDGTKINWHMGFWGKKTGDLYVNGKWKTTTGESTNPPSQSREYQKYFLICLLSVTGDTHQYYTRYIIPDRDRDSMPGDGPKIEDRTFKLKSNLKFDSYNTSSDNVRLSINDGYVSRLYEKSKWNVAEIIYYHNDAGGHFDNSSIVDNLKSYLNDKYGNGDNFNPSIDLNTYITSIRPIHFNASPPAPAPTSAPTPAPASINCHDCSQYNTLTECWGWNWEWGCEWDAGKCDNPTCVSVTSQTSSAPTPAVGGSTSTDFNASPPAMDGIYTIQHKINNRYLDAWTMKNDDECWYDCRVTTRSAQNNDSQRWILTKQPDNSYTIQHKVNDLYLDAYTSGSYNVITRDAQNNDSRRWILTKQSISTITRVRTPVTGVRTTRVTQPPTQPQRHQPVTQRHQPVTGVRTTPATGVRTTRVTQQPESLIYIGSDKSCRELSKTHPDVKCTYEIPKEIDNSFINLDRELNSHRKDYSFLYQKL